jgi:hypothetical protein
MNSVVSSAQQSRRTFFAECAPAFRTICAVAHSKQVAPGNRGGFRGLSFNVPRVKRFSVVTTSGAERARMRAY